MARSRNRSRSSSISLRVGAKRVTKSLGFKSPPPINIPKFKKYPLGLFIALFTGTKEPGTIDIPEYNPDIVEWSVGENIQWSGTDDLEWN